MAERRPPARSGSSSPKGGSSPKSGSSPRARCPESPGPVVQRRGQATRDGHIARKPTARETLDSIVSTGTSAEYFRPDQTIILFDWDDTLCPSNWIRENRPALSFFRPCPDEERFKKPLAELSNRVEAVLNLALKMGKVVIVTNAQDPWVETSCRNYLPSVMSLVEKIPVIYARSVWDNQQIDQDFAGPAGRRLQRPVVPGMYSPKGGGANAALSGVNAKLAAQSHGDGLEPQRWKELAFEMEIAGFYSRYAHQSWKNIISIGDSVFERDAVRRVVLNRPTGRRRCYTKTAKLLDEPSIEELIAQVVVVHDALGLMVQHDGNLDIEIDEEDLQLEIDR